MQSPNPTFKIALIGPANVGKSAFLRRHVTGEFEKNYVPTLGVEVHPLRFCIASASQPELAKEVVLNIWDCAGQEKYGGLREGYLLKADAVIAIFDIRDNKETVDHWLDVAKKPACTIILCANKCDLKENHVKNAEWNTLPLLQAKYKQNLPFYQVSARSNYNFEKPFLHAVRALMRVEDIVFAESPHANVPPIATLPIQADELPQEDEVDFPEEEEVLCARCQAEIVQVK